MLMFQTNSYHFWKCTYVYVLIECSAGKFGQNCIYLCGHCLKKEQCHYINGTCLHGCHVIFSGECYDRSIIITVTRTITIKVDIQIIN